MSRSASRCARLADMVFMEDFNAKLIAEFRANDGKLTGDFGKAPILIITMTGAKSGVPRTAPLAYTRDGDRLVLVASMGGAPNNPAWYHNLVANPVVTVELPGETFEARATEVTGDERDRLYAGQAKVLPQFNEYQAKTTRRIPVFVLERTGS